MKPHEPLPSPAGRRAWLAALLLNHHSRVMPRFFHAYARLSGLGRPARRRLRRSAAAGALALALTVGAVATRPPAVYAATITVDDGVVAPADDGQCSLVEAFHNANTNTQLYASAGECAAGAYASDVIELPANGSFTFMAAYDSHGAGPEPTGVIVTTDITLQGNGSTISRDSGAADFHLIAVLDVVNSNLFMTDVTITGGKGGRGGALYNDSFMTLDGVTIMGNEATVAGGGIYHSGNSLNLEGSTVTGNTAPDGGGVISIGAYSAGACVLPTPTINVNNSTISENTANYGGGVFSYCATTSIYASDVTGNDAAEWGGGVLIDEEPAVITASNISGNTAEREGGGIYLDTGLVQIYDSTLNDNKVYDDGHGGGAVYSNGDMQITDTVMTGNTSQVYGGAINVDGGQLTLTRVMITGNTADDRGGAIFAFGVDVDITDSTISNNDSLEYEGGGVFMGTGTLDIAGTTISGNTASSDGGGIYTRATTTISNSTISGNDAERGGGIYNDSSVSLAVSNSTISGNDATNGDGGGIYTDQTATTTVTNSTITGNTATGNGGGVYGFNGSTTILARSVVSGNSAGAGDEVGRDPAGGTITADEYNVFGHSGIANADAFSNFTPGASDVPATSDGSDPTALTAILDTTLADNGGPTLTHNLVANSPAVDLAPGGDCALAPTGGVDQRGAPRPFDVAGQGNDAPSADTCDAGAVEFGSPMPGAVFMSTTAAGTTADGLAFGPHDVLEWDGIEWSKKFDGTATGLTPNGNAKHNINAFALPHPDGSNDVFIAFAQNSRAVPGIPGKVDGTDLVIWGGAYFLLGLDGSDVGLANLTQEKIDGLHFLPGEQSPINGGDCEWGYLLISTTGPGKVPNHSGGTLSFSGEDVLGFCATSLGPNTAGKWHMFLDGSQQGMPKNSTDSISLSADGQTLYLTTKGTFNVDDATGGHSMVYAYDMTTGEFSGPVFSAPANGLPGKVDGLQFDVAP